MDKSLNGGKLVNVTQYGNRLPVPQAPSRLSVAKEEARMKAEKDSLNAMEKASPNPLYPEKDKKKKKTQAKITPDALKNMTQEELDEILSEFAGSKKNPITELMQSSTQPQEQDQAMQDMLDKFATKLSAPQFGEFQAPTSYRFPGFFQG